MEEVEEEETEVEGDVVVDVNGCSSGGGGDSACIFMVRLAKTSRQPQNDGSLESPFNAQALIIR
jgi:hypothetical protein